MKAAVEILGGVVVALVFLALACIPYYLTIVAVYWIESQVAWLGVVLLVILVVTLVLSNPFIIGPALGILWWDSSLKSALFWLPVALAFCLVGMVVLGSLGVAVESWGALGRLVASKLRTRVRK